MPLKFLTPELLKALFEYAPEAAQSISQTLENDVERLERHDKEKLEQHFKLKQQKQRDQNSNIVRLQWLSFVLVIIALILIGVIGVLTSINTLWVVTLAVVGGSFSQTISCYFLFRKAREDRLLAEYQEP